MANGERSVKSDDEAVERRDAPDSGKLISKEDANYREGTAFERCGKCQYYSNHRCKIVDGDIEPMMLCDHFEAPDDMAHKAIPKKKSAPKHDSDEDRDDAA
jgi:hypothetical protein